MLHFVDIYEIRTTKITLESTQIRNYDHALKVPNFLKKSILKTKDIKRACSFIRQVRVMFNELV